jgi:hypothetical protein
METRSSASSPLTVRVPPLKLAEVAVKATFASISCGVALTVFSSKVAPPTPGKCRTPA